jgi:hypothetical protein
MREYMGTLPEGKPYITEAKHYADQPHLRAAYAGMVTRTDTDVGRILARVREQKLEDDSPRMASRSFSRPGRRSDANLPERQWAMRSRAGEFSRYWSAGYPGWVMLTG